MTLPASPPLNMFQICNEFGAPPTTTPLTALVRGGAYVPNIAANAAVPTAPPISMLDFLNASQVTAQLLQVDESAGTLSPADCTISVAFQSNGQVRVAKNGAPSTLLYNWLVVGAVTDFQFMFDGQGGDLGFVTGPAFGVWISGGTTSTYLLTNASNLDNLKTFDCTVHVRRVSDSVETGSASVGLQAQVTV